MSTSDLAMFIVWIVMGIALFALGIFLFFWNQRLKRRCKSRVDAIICGVKKQSLKLRHKRTYYDLPVYQYTVNGQEYQKISSVRHMVGTVEIGRMVVLFVDEENPKHAYNPVEDEDHVTDSILWCVVGLGSIASAFLGAFAIFASIGLYALVYMLWLKFQSK